MILAVAMLVSGVALGVAAATAYFIYKLKDVFR